VWSQVELWGWERIISAKSRRKNRSDERGQRVGSDRIKIGPKVDKRIEIEIREKTERMPRGAQIGSSNEIETDRISRKHSRKT